MRCPEGSDHVTWRSRLRWGSDVGAISRGDRGKRKVKKGRRNARVDELVRPHVFARHADVEQRFRKLLARPRECRRSREHPT
jgi:hypothetical protein